LTITSLFAILCLARFFLTGMKGRFAMALIKFGGGVTAMSGSIAGNVFARNRYGYYVRPRTKPVNPRSDRQVAMRTIVSYLSEYWHGDLDDVERGSWAAYAAAVGMLNKLGEVIHLTGFNHFIRSNSMLLKIAEDILDSAPTILSLPEKDTLLTCSAESIAEQTFTFTCDTEGWAANGDTKLGIFIHMGTPQMDSRNFFNGPWRYMDYIDAIEGAAGTGTYEAPFSFALGQKIWFKARLVTESGRLSEAWALSPRVVEADA
jgi:hypothetical protein